MYEFIVKKDKNNNLVLFKNIKGLFGKIKQRKADKTELFTYSREAMKNGFYAISPSIDGMSLEQYLELKSKYANNCKFSDFGTRTVWKFDMKDDNCSSVFYNDHEFFEGKMVGDISVYDSKGNLILSKDNFIFPYFSYSKMTPKIVQLLLQNACNGVYQSARDLEAELKEKNKAEYGENVKKDIYVCEECGEKFDSLDAFYCHLIENKHYDSIFDSHPYDSECQRVRLLASKEK